MVGKSGFGTANLAGDVYDVVSSWLACKDPIPEGWKDKTSPMYEANFVLVLPYIETQILAKKQ